MNTGLRYDKENLILCVSLAFLIYTVNHKERDILFLTITLANLSQFL